MVTLMVTDSNMMVTEGNMMVTDGNTTITQFLDQVVLQYQQVVHNLFEVASKIVKVVQLHGCSCHWVESTCSKSNGSCLLPYPSCTLSSVKLFHSVSKLSE